MEPSCNISRHHPRELGLTRSELRPLLAALVAQAVSALQDWCECWPRFDTMSRDWQRRRLSEAQEADRWFLADVERIGHDDEGVLFPEVCYALGIDPDRFIERLYGRLDPAAVQALWSHPGLPDGRRHRSATAAA